MAVYLEVSAGDRPEVWLEVFRQTEGDGDLFRDPKVEAVHDANTGLFFLHLTFDEEPTVEGLAMALDGLDALLETANKRSSRAEAEVRPDLEGTAMAWWKRYKESQTHTSSGGPP
jgi:hypothetical protein